jgi:hypothetical protein
MEGRLLIVGRPEDQLRRKAPAESGAPKPTFAALQCRLGRAHRRDAAALASRSMTP